MASCIMSNYYHTCTSGNVHLQIVHTYIHKGSIFSTPPIICFCTVPSQVTRVDVSKATHSGQPALSVTWTTPQSELTISKYQVQYRRSGTKWRAASPVSPGLNTSTLLEALDAGTVYEVRIRAVSAIGNGTWSEVESETTYMSELCSESN